MDPNQVINMDFVGLCPGDDDVTGIENLCKQLLKHWNIDLNDLAKILVEQNYVTNVLKEAVDDEWDSGHGREESDDEMDVESEGTVYGVYGMISLKTRKNDPSIKQLLEFVLRSAEQTPHADYFKQILSNDSTNAARPALLVKEKILNIPGVAVAPMMQQLFNDVREAIAKGMNYDFTHYIHIAKLVRITRITNKKQDYFVDEDDELIHKFCSQYVDVYYNESIDSLTSFQNDKGKMVSGKSFRRIYLLTSEHLRQYMSDVLTQVGVKETMQQAATSGLQCA